MDNKKTNQHLLVSSIVYNVYWVMVHVWQLLQKNIFMEAEMEMVLAIALIMGTFHPAKFVTSIELCFTIAFMMINENS